MLLCLSDAEPVSNTELASIPGLKHLYLVRSSLRVVTGILSYVSDARTSPAFVVPQSHRGVMLMHAHDSPYKSHKGFSATHNALKQVAYWPNMQKDVADYIKICKVCCQSQPAKPSHRAALQRRGISFPLSKTQFDRREPLTEPARGNKHFLAGKNNLDSTQRCKVYNDQNASHNKLRRGDRVCHHISAPLRKQDGQRTGRLAHKFSPHWTDPSVVTDKQLPGLDRTKLQKNPMGLVGTDNVLIN